MTTKIWNRTKYSIIIIIMYSTYISDFLINHRNNKLFDRQLVKFVEQKRYYEDAYSNQ